MKALLRKELVQILPAHVLVAAVLTGFGLWAVPPEHVFLPSPLDIESVYAGWMLISILEGLLIGFFQHVRERSSGTEAYLVHRASGRLQAFLAKSTAGLAALAVVITIPPTVFGLWWVVLSKVVENGLTERLWYLVALGGCSLPAYGIGVLTAQLRMSNMLRAVFALVGSLTLLFGSLVALRPAPDTLRTSLPAFASFLFLATTVLLVVAYPLFRAGEDEHRPWPGRVGSLVGVAALAVYWLPLSLIVSEIQRTARLMVLTSLPEVVEDRDGRLLLASRHVLRDKGSDHTFLFSDVEGQRVELQPDQVLCVFRPEATPLERTRPLSVAALHFPDLRSFAFDGPWITLGWGERASPWLIDAWFNRSEGLVAILEDRGDAPPKLIQVGTPPDDRAFSTETFATFQKASPMLVDLHDRSIWKLVLDLHRLRMIQEDELLGVEPVHFSSGLRFGIYETDSLPQCLLLTGKKDRYVPISPGVAPAGQASDAVRWRLEPSRADGISFHLDVVDARTGQVALAHDFQPEGREQVFWAAVATATALARSALGAAWSHFSAAFDPRDIRRMDVIGMFRDPLLLGGARPGLLAANVAVGLALACLARHRLGRDRRERAVRWTWTIAVFLLGLPAWFLCWLLEPSRRTLAARSRQSSEFIPPLIATSRSARFLEPALSRA